MKKNRSIDSYSQSVLSVSAPLAWLYVSVLAGTYAACTLMLHYSTPVDSTTWRTFAAEVPSSVFQWQLAAFGGVLVLNIINLMFCSTPVQYNCNVLLTLIHGVAFATDWLIERQATPIVVSWGGHMFLPLRYVQWLHTTPTMILIMSMMSDMSSSQVAVAVVGDLVMVITGLAASWTDGGLQMAMLGTSVAGFCVVMHAIINMFKSAIAESSTGHTSRMLLGRMLGLTLFVWTLFPLVWLAAYGGLIGIVWEQVLWGVSDYSAKVVFSSHLWQKNLATVQQRREAAQELMGALDRGLLLERVRALVASKEKLVYALSHELRAPINGMLALVQELLHNKTQSSASRTKMLMMIRSSATCLLNTLNTTVSTTATADGAAVTAANKHMRKVNLYRVAETVLRLTRPMVKEHVRLINCISRDMPPVKGDSMRLMQVLMNLVCTCLKFTHSGDIKVSATATHSTAHVVVADTGSGLPPGQLQQALNPFEDAEGEPADVWDVCRNGLGLYLVQQALSSMGSSIDATSELGRGSTFRFDLLLADEECDSESDVEHADMFSEAGSLRASLEMAELDAASWRTGGSSESQQTNSSADLTSLRPPPSSTAASSSFMAPSASGTNTTASSTASTAEPNPAAAAAAASSAAAAAGLDSFIRPSSGLSSSSRQQQQGLVPGSRSLDLGRLGSALARPSSPLHAGGSAAAAAAAAAGQQGVGSPGAGLGVGPQKPSHRSRHNGVIQVLSVDDDPVNQLVAMTSLKSNKWEVVKSMSGGEALTWLDHADSLPDLVLLDVMMPSMSGFEVARRIREVYPSSLLPIIMVSAKTEEDDIVKGLHCGADDYITKPFKRAELSARIRAHIRARDAFQQQQAVEQQWLLQHNLLPANVQRKLRAGETVIAESHPAATVLWAEVVNAPAAAAAVGPVVAVGNAHKDGDLGIGAAAAAAAAAAPAAAAADGSSGGLTPAEAVVTLNSLYTTWEELCAQQEVLGVDFSGSTFVAVSGHDDNPQHLQLILRTADAMLSAAAGMRHADGNSIAVKVGIHLGPLTTGLVGHKAVKLVLMGDTVEVAKQLAASGAAGSCHISAAVHDSMRAGSADLAAAAAAAMPCTLQQLPGSVGMQHTYLLRRSGGIGEPAAAAAAAAPVGEGSNGELRSDAAASVQQQQQHLGMVSSAASPTAVIEGVANSVAAPSLLAAAAAAPSAASGAGAVAHEVSTGRLSRFLRIGTKPAAAGISSSGSSNGLATDAAAAATTQQQQQGLAPVGSLDSSIAPQQQQQQQQHNIIGSSGRTLGESATPTNANAPVAAAAAPANHTAISTTISTALPAPPPGGTVGFVTSGLRSHSSSCGSIARSSREVRHAAAAAGVGHVAAAGPGAVGSQQQHQQVEVSVDSWLQAQEAQSRQAAAPQQQQQQHPAATANQAASVLTQTSSSQQQQQQQHNSPPAPVMQQQQQQQSPAEIQQQHVAATAGLLHDLTVERRELQQQLIARTQQHAAAAAELTCVRQQLSDAQSQITNQSVIVEQLRQQVGQAIMRAYLADCLRALLQMKAQISGLSGLGGLGGLGFPAEPQLGNAVGNAPSSPMFNLQAVAAGLPLTVVSGGLPALPGSVQMLSTQQQQQQQQQQQGLEVGFDSGTSRAAATAGIVGSSIPSPTGAVAVSDGVIQDNSVSAAAAAAGNGSSTAGPYFADPAAAAAAAGADSSSSMQQWLAAQAAQLAALQQQQIALMSGLQQQQQQQPSAGTPEPASGVQHNHRGSPDSGLGV